MQEQYTEIKYNDSINKENIEIAVGLGLVDNLKPSKYFYEALEKSKTYTELESSIKTHYEQSNQTKESEKECDIVSVNIAKYLEKSGFSFSPVTLKTIHRSFFY